MKEAWWKLLTSIWKYVFNLQTTDEDKASRKSTTQLFKGELMPECHMGFYHGISMQERADTALNVYHLWV